MFTILADFNFSTIVLEPSNVHNSAISFQIINDLIPEARKEYTIFIEDVNLADEREGALPVTNGNISIQLYDNDCEFIMIAIYDPYFNIMKGLLRTLYLCTGT